MFSQGPVVVPLLALLAPLGAAAFQLVRTAPDGSTYVSFMVVFFCLSAVNLIIFGLVAFFCNQRRRRIVRDAGQGLKYELLDFDEVDGDWKRLPEAQSSKQKKNDLLQLRKEQLSEKAQKSSKKE